MTLLLLLGAGVCFALWPHAMREARFSPGTVLMMYGLVSCLGGLAIVVSAGHLPELHGRNLRYGLAAGAMNALGGLLFAWVLTRRSRAQLAQDVIVLLVIQVVLNALWAAYQSGAIGWRLAAGTTTAILTILLLR